ncbi:hypothetical protein QQX98_001369 [Neonectria punicea]|uniref:Heterokaryon incompatibility domain-containing protein n=1 Tax=Neonectria punicea TaxID=979145 RepID=A0ABR1HQ02_9HYPO
MSALFTHAPDLGVLPTQWLLDTSTGSEKTYTQIRHWVKNCTETHRQCARRHTDRSLVPTRLLDLGPGDSSWPSHLVRLIVTKPDFREPYLTLSHSWGQKQFLTLQDSNLEQFLQSGLPWDELSKNKNFVQAIEVARNLGARYIWIDSLCIIQRQDNIKLELRDWFKEGQLMHRYYRNSWCNIVASG